VTKTAMLCLIVLVLLIPFLFLSHVSAKARLNEDQALKVLLSSMKEEGLYGSMLDTSCFSIFAEERDKDYFDFTVHENRGGNCPGSVNASPTVQRFRVDRSTKRVQWVDGADRLRPLKAFKKSRPKS
jgi:hypothetical protein